MKLKLVRKFKKDKYTIGVLYIDGVRFSNTMEDKDRGLKDSMSLEEIKKKKVYGETAIPTGTYKITLNTIFNKFAQKPFYQENANKGRLPYLENVKGYSGILIHCGNTEKDSLGCILVGENLEKGKVLKTKETFIKLYKILQSAKDDITITIE